MNSRTLSLLLVVVALCGGLAFVVLSGPQTPARSGGPLVSDLNTTGPGPARDDQGASRSAPAARAQLVSPADTWTVIVVGPKGEPLPDAKIVARCDGTTETSRGRALFTGLESGTWTLTVESEGLPTYHEDVVLIPGKPTRTFAQLTNKIRVSGFVVDERGEPVGGVNLWLLAEGTEHPKDGKVAADLEHSIATNDGRFKLTADEPGRWRLTAGRPGNRPRFESEPFDLDFGRERSVRVVVPARARLRVEVAADDFKGKNVISVLGQREQAPPAETTVSDGGETKTRDGQKRGMTDEEILRRKKEALGDSGSDDGSDAGKPLNLAELSAQQQARMREAEERAERERQRRARLIEEGWTNLRSARVDSGGFDVIDELPEEKPLRFVLYRGAEGLLINESVVAPKGCTLTLTLTPPPPLPPGTDLPDYPRTTGSRLDIGRLGKEALPVGLTFEN
ncbi:MAG: carboxypeptidase-like regulatory domain-containing protein [Planctomycetota bacterium]